MPRLGSLIAQSARPLYSLIATWVERHSDLWSTRFYLPGPGGDTPRSPEVCSLPHETPASLPNTPDLLGFSVRVRGTTEVNVTWNTSFCKIIVQCSICSLGIKRIFFFFPSFFLSFKRKRIFKNIKPKPKLFLLSWHTKWMHIVGNSQRLIFKGWNSKDFKKDGQI